jgi:hypothetical protein
MSPSELPLRHPTGDTLSPTEAPLQSVSPGASLHHRNDAQVPAAAGTAHVRENAKVAAQRRLDIAAASKQRQADAFVTVSHFPRCDDMRTTYMQSGCVGHHRVPYIEAAAFACRVSPQRTTAIMYEAQCTADLRAGRRPEPPKSVTDFFGDDDFIAQDDDYSAALRSSVRRHAKAWVSKQHTTAGVQTPKPPSVPQPPTATPAHSAMKHPASARTARQTDRSVRMEIVCTPRASAASATATRASRLKRQLAANQSPRRGNDSFADDPRDVNAWASHVAVHATTPRQPASTATSRRPLTAR